MLLCPNSPQTSFNWFGKVDNKCLELAVLIYILCKQAKAAQIELAERNTPELRPPLKLLATAKDNFYGHLSLDDMPSKCTFGSCFDLSRCPLSSGFPVYFYNNLYGWTSTKVKILDREVGSNTSFR